MEDNRYEFLQYMEQTYENCSMICNPQLFTITRDVSEGIPLQECLMVALEQATVTADSASVLLKFGAVMVLLSAPLSFPVC